jgi:hypothetical protein
MADNLFDDSIDLLQLAESEEAIFEEKETPPTTSDSDVSKNKKETKDNNKEEAFIENEDSLSLEELALLDEENSEESSGEDLDKSKTRNNNKKPPADESDSVSSSAGVLTSLAGALKEAGVFSSLEEEDINEIKDVDSLIKAVEKQIKTNEYSFLNEEQKEYLEALEAGVPLETYSKVKSNAAQYEAIQDEQIEKNVNLTYELIRRGFIIDGVSSQKAESLAKLAIKEEDAVERAIEAKSALIKYELDLIEEEKQAKLEEKNNLIKEEQNKIAALKSKILEKEELISGIKFNTQTRDKIFNSLTTPVKGDKNGNLKNEVMDLYDSDDDYKLRLHTLHVITKGFTDFSKIEKTTKTKAIKDLEEKLNSGEVSNHGSASSGFRGATSSSIGKALETYVPSFKVRK